MFLYFLFVGPPLLLAMIAQWMVSSAYRQMSQVGTRMSGFEAARRILDANGLRAVDIEPISGQLSDHYDPTARVLRLSQDVYQGYSMAAVGIAAHEAGHAIQHAKHYAPLMVRNLAVPVANFGASLSGIFMMVAFGLMFLHSPLGQFALLLGILGFGATVVFQVINLPVEFDASSRAKTQLVQLGLISGPELPYVSRVLNAAALTYVAATLQALMTMLYYITIFMDMNRSNRD